MIKVVTCSETIQEILNRLTQEGLLQIVKTLQLYLVHVFQFVDPFPLFCQSLDGIIIISLFCACDRFHILVSLFLFASVKTLQAFYIGDRMLIFELRCTECCIFEEKFASGSSVGDRTFF